ncbi:MAG: cytochrome c3 family protein [Gemmatimonadota bacterium]|nr:MAG: cytochrome c3 family protein [Gemmatimonadota bacterium]
MTGTLLALGAALLVGAAPAAPTTGWAPQGLAAQDDSAYGCIICHADKRRSFTLGVHSDYGIRCDDCHGGDPTAYEIDPAHRGRFLGTPTKLEIIELCSVCHADPNQMRQFGLAADQLAEFRTSRHGQLLLEQGNTDAPTCTDCHNAHLILPPEDARSEVHPTNIPATCGRCHEDAQLMAKYGEPIDQYERYRTGAHGIGVFEKRNFASPTCIGCHGSHAALPPAVTQIADVCGRCHLLLERAFYQGPHGGPARSGTLPGCLGCHSNHGTERTAPEAIAALCVRCHEPESAPALMGVELQEEVLRATEELHYAADAIEEMVEMGHEVADERFRYQSAVSEYNQIALVQHSLNFERLEDLGLAVRSNTGIIRATAEVHAEEQWEHKLLLIPVWFLTLAVIVLAWFKLREEQP